MTTWKGFVPLRGKPKARPRITRHGTFMPRDYMAWREEFGVMLRNLKVPKFEGMVMLRLDFRTDGVDVSLADVEGVKRPKHVRADIDNLIGAVMEVLEDIGVVKNDRNIVHVVAVSYDDEEADG